MAHPHASPRRPMMRELGGAHSFRASTYQINRLDKKLTLLERVPVLQQLLRDHPEHEAGLISALEPVVFREGEHIFRQGCVEKAIYFVESGRVGLTQRQWKRHNSFNAVVARMKAVSAGKAEMNVWTYEPFDSFNEMSLFGVGPSEVNAVAQGSDGAVCYVIRLVEALTFFDELLPLLWYRCQLRLDNTLGSCDILKNLSNHQHQYLINYCSLEYFDEGDRICQQHDRDDKMFVLVQGSVRVYYDEIVPEKNDMIIDEHSEESDDLDLESEAPTAPPELRSVILAEHHDICCFAEMGLLKRPRTAHVIAIPSTGVCVNKLTSQKRPPLDVQAKCDGLKKVVCIVITRELYHNSIRLGNGHVDLDAEDVLANSFAAEWNLVRNARNLQLSNPKVAYHLVKFLKTFQTAYNERLAGDNIYSAVLRKLTHNCQLSNYFDPITLRAAWGMPALPSLGLLRSETRRVLSLAPSARTIADVNFIARVLDTTILFNHFNIPRQMEPHKVALELSKYIGFLHVRKNTLLFKQGRVENKAFVILCGSIHIVSEDAPIRRGPTQDSTAMEPTDAETPRDVLATLPGGCVFGELALAASLPRSASAITASDTDLLVIERTHIECLRKALPEVSLRHAMIDRAQILSKIGFMTGCDFIHCVRLAYDTQERICDVRYVFPNTSNSIFIVQRGEVGVYLRRPIVESSPCHTNDDHTFKPAAVPSKTSNRPASVNTIDTRSAQKEGLVRVATIGQHGFFLTGNVSTKLDNPNECVCQLGNHSSTVFMCQTEVAILELSEDRWRRIAFDNQMMLRNALIERHQWNMEAVWKQQYPIFHAIDKPWVSLSRIKNKSNASCNDGAPVLFPSLCKTGCTCKLCGQARGSAESLLGTTRLSRRLYKKTTSGNITELMRCKSKRRQRSSKSKSVDMTLPSSNRAFTTPYCPQALAI
uniref:Protein kinase putative n=1 Tax=Albugo laibachii Nc14 TaxID=890382 RepID=F0WY46_9STRA|nr:protein kinase putative [Albugo laibachii Nc14]|eukprot:CCA26396.1 protein kinase putative [Albugo laibachii Nc14]